MRAAILTLSLLLLGSSVASAQESPAPEAAPAEPPVAPAAESAAPPAEAAAAAPAEPADTTPAELTEAELQQLGFDAAEPAVDYDVHFSGFMDFGINFAIGESEILTGKPSFAIGNINLYLSKNLTESVRTMAEIRFMYLPNGSPKSLADRTMIDTTVSDYADFNRELRWGAVEIERVYVEWSALHLLTIRAGQFLTPYGVWNVDHGSPTIIPVNRPFVIGYNFFPERQTGFELYGRWEATANGTFGYHLTLSNGTGPASEYLDLDNNKAIGGRIYWEYRKWGELKLGGSAYYGRQTAATTSGQIVDGKLVTSQDITNQWDKLALALDATFKFQGLHIQSEFVTQQTAYTEEGRTAAFSLATFQNTYPADGFRWGGYVLLGYRFDWFGIMPYAVIQLVGGTDPNLQFEDRGTIAVFGLNVRPIDSLVGKIEFAQVFFPDGAAFPGFDIQVLSAQLAWAF